MYISNGDTVNVGAEILKISSSNDLSIDFQFSYANDGDFYVGQPARIYINGYAGYLDGTVAQVGGSSIANGTGMKMTTVRVKAANPGLVSGDCTASATIGNYTSYGRTAVKVGTGSNSSNALCAIYDLSYLQMTLNIDELDIDNVAVGQVVNITSDAKEGQTFTGVVTRVSVVGTTSGGTTTYPVTVRIDDTEGLRPGMNVDAEIVLSSADDVLAVPSLAVNRGNTVLITADSPSAVNALDQEAPEGYVYVSVETGVSDDSYIEITSGLQEGDTVAYLRTASGSSDFMMGGIPGGDMGGQGDGMPGGGGMASGGPGGGGRGVF